MLDIYKQIKENEIKCGQTSSGIWYCKELPASTPKELEQLIGEVNAVLNTYNKEIKERKTPTPPKKEQNKKLDTTKGLV